MNEPQPATWPRPHWTPSEEPALLLYFVFGTFPAELRIPAGKYASRGLPQGIELLRYPHDALKPWAGYPLSGAIGDLLREDNAQAFAASADTPEVISMRGRITDPASLDYLRDALGVLAGLLDIGGISVVDPQILSMYSNDAWRQTFLHDGGASMRQHALIVCSNDEDGDADEVWVHTRGMRKFARPDLSVRGVPKAHADQAGILCERLLEMQALGAHFVEDQPIEIAGLPSGMRVHHTGSMDDPRFNNTHIELRWP